MSRGSTTRRALLGSALAGAGLAGLGLAGLGPLGASRARAAGEAEERRFLFVFCRGGWDPACVLAPQFGASGVDMEPAAERAQSGGIDWVDHPERPSVRAWFERYHARAAILRGFEVQSITHERCRQILMTGQGDVPRDDWGTLLAARGSLARALPYLVLGGPSFTDLHGDQVVRVGASGQLSMLLDGSAVVDGTDIPTRLPSPTGQALADGFVRNRTRALEAIGRSVRDRDLARRYGQALDRIDALDTLGLELDTQTDASSRWPLFTAALDCLELGASRCASVEYDGLYSMTFDTHSAGYLQGYHWEELFGYLLRLSAELDARPGRLGGRLSDEVTVVVYSEMGRGPKLNTTEGKDHFTHTSAMLFGAGVAGDRVVGGYDDAGFGRAIDLDDGTPREGGETLLAAHLGATLLAMGDVDPVDAGITAPPIQALLD